MTAAHLRIVNADNPPRERLPLREAYVVYKLPELDGRRASATIRNYRTALTHWERFCEVCASTISTRAAIYPATECTDDVYMLTDELLNNFAKWLREYKPGGGGLNVDSVGKTWKILRAVLRKVGPRETGNPRGMGLIPRVPVMDSIGDLEGYEDENVSEGATDITVEQLGALYEACSAAEWPTSCTVPAAIQWRGWIVLGSLLGIRVEQLNAAEFAWFRMEASSPAKGSNRRHEPGWLSYTPEKTKRSKRVRLVVPLPPCVRLHLDALSRHGRLRLFDFGSAGSNAARQQWIDIAERAGVPHLQRCDLRDTANQIWGAVNRDLGRWVCGHAARDVNERHYTRIEPDLIAAIPQLVVPAQFERGPHSTHQQFLF